MTNKRLYRMVFTALMAAIVFVTTIFPKITVTTPAGPTMIKVSNAFCLMSGMLLGPLYGGLASGIGSMLYDLSDPVFAPSAPFTFAFFFAMGCICGLIARSGSRKGNSFGRNLAGAVSGALTYWLLYIAKSVLVLVFAGSGLWAAVAACGMKMITSLINAGIAVIFSTLAAKSVMAALQKSGLTDKLK